MSSQANSWVGAGANEPVTGKEVEDVVGSEEIDRIASRLGISREEAADDVAQVLPALVDRVSPEGQLPPDSDLDSVFAKLANVSVS
jgi:uncharacterized protein YidB (DUF937 family)